MENFARHKVIDMLYVACEHSRKWFRALVGRLWLNTIRTKCDEFNDIENKVLYKMYSH